VVGLRGSLGSLDSLAVAVGEWEWEGVVGVVGRDPVPAPSERECAEDPDEDRARLEVGLELGFAEVAVRRRVRSGRMVNCGTLECECEEE